MPNFNLTRVKKNSQADFVGSSEKDQKNVEFAKFEIQGNPEKEEGDRDRNETKLKKIFTIYNYCSTINILILI